MNGYLNDLLAQARGAPAGVRARPKARFEGESDPMALEDNVIIETTTDVPPTTPHALPADAPSPLETVASRVEPVMQAPRVNADAPPEDEQPVESHHVFEVTRRLIEHETVIETHELRRRAETPDTPRKLPPDHVAPARHPAFPPEAPLPQGCLAPPADIPVATPPASSMPQIVTTPPVIQARRPTARLPEHKPALLPESTARIRPSAQTARPAPEPEITVSIGRLDIRLIDRPEPPRAASAPTPDPRRDGPSLDQYLSLRQRDAR